MTNCDVYSKDCCYFTQCYYHRLFCQRVAKHVSLDCTYIELLPTLYRNEPTEVGQAFLCAILSLFEIISLSYVRQSISQESGPLIRAVPSGAMRRLF